MNANAGSRAERPYLNPYVAGAVLGIVLFATFYVTGGGLGASAALNRVQVGVLDWIAPRHVDRTAYLAEMAGGHRNPWNNYGVFMLVGTVLGGFASGLLHGRVRPELRKGPHISTGTRVAFALLGGTIMGYGARLARGCTSGQALSGGAGLSVGSWAFAFSVFASAYALAWFVRRLWT
ncbi:MAG TPA: YeeE/YedE thiosulfate transporter family protein [Anaeromyxobacteraceae bacterium]|nr:YeeE/YedE thiosulfate transporter family protein [Anaeromyxobacteraceae bacterium]